MRATLFSLPLLLALSGCVTAPADGSERIQTTSDAKRESVQSAVAAPLRDVNVLRTKIPTVLLEAMADPYQRPAHASCAVIALAPAAGDASDRAAAPGATRRPPPRP